MNKLFIGLLILAAGAGVFFFLRKQNQKETIMFNKEWMVGKWKLDSIVHKDPAKNHNLIPDADLKSFQYNFIGDSSLLQITGDSGSVVRLHYQWKNENKLMVTDNVTDTVGDVFTITQLTNDKMIVLSADSMLLFFMKPNYID